MLSQGFAQVSIITDGGSQEAQCLRLDMIPFWLSGVNANRVGEAVREKLLRYQTEVASVLWAAFKHEILPAEELPQELPQRSGAELAYEIATAVQHLARQQMELEQRLNSRLDAAGRWAKTIDERLTILELTVGPDQTISEQQATEIALAVKNVGRALSERGTKPGYSQVYGELYRRYGISSYKSLPQKRYDSVLAWLKSWYEELSEDSFAP